jgi:flagellar basal-body rod modification protein FlgD
MAVDGVTSSTSTSSSASTTTTTKTSTDDAAAAGLNYDSFLKLLVAQMKNQDPTDPMDASEQMSQLASFSQVEQSIKTNSHLEDLLSQSQLSQAASLVGKTVESADGTVSGTVKSVEVTSDATTATLTDGKTVTIESGITISNPS